MISRVFLSCRRVTWTLRNEDSNTVFSSGRRRIADCLCNLLSHADDNECLTRIRTRRYSGYLRSVGGSRYKLVNHWRSSKERCFGATFVKTEARFCFIRDKSFQSGRETKAEKQHFFTVSNSEILRICKFLIREYYNMELIRKVWVEIQMTGSWWGRIWNNSEAIKMITRELDLCAKK